MHLRNGRPGMRGLEVAMTARSGRRQLNEKRQDEVLDLTGRLYVSRRPKVCRRIPVIGHATPAHNAERGSSTRKRAQSGRPQSAYSTSYESDIQDSPRFSVSLWNQESKDG